MFWACLTENLLHHFLKEHSYHTVASLVLKMIHSYSLKLGEGDVHPNLAEAVALIPPLRKSPSPNSPSRWPELLRRNLLTNTPALYPHVVQEIQTKAV